MPRKSTKSAATKSAATKPETVTVDLKQDYRRDQVLYLKGKNREILYALAAELGLVEGEEGGDDPDEGGGSMGSEDPPSNP